ncbi:hypothetical protein SCLCIDRAFT_1217001 [Scleroderma citrinum Foug A]|uniref:Uncharacterized protein n=1 Tax=Scleroderma citrinum Foug A TaxID=1036808 RepID=A0A0C3DWF8_9AGAM|nr:hypothetical protein SCLCIDRAFT_1217001 [Scleroderma citrinum Foug A]
MADIACNLSVPNDGLVRNARVRITTLHRRFIEVLLLDNDSIHCIPRIAFSFNVIRSNWTVVRRQNIPPSSRLRYYFNGCQGLTLDRSAVDIRTDSFARGQLTPHFLAFAIALISNAELPLKY